VSSVRDELLFLRDMGFTHVDVAGGWRLAAGGSAELPAVSDHQAAPPAASRQPPADSSDDWTNLRTIALACTQCRLSQSRTQVVYGVGNPHAELMFIGEAPGRDEDLKGEPFVGRATMSTSRTSSSAVPLRTATPSRMSWTPAVRSSSARLS